jgi:hypothetical protein
MNMAQDTIAAHTKFEAKGGDIGQGIRWSSVIVPSTVDNEVQEALTFRCMTGWQLVGPEMLYCNIDTGNWTRRIPGRTAAAQDVSAAFPRCHHNFQSLESSIGFDELQRIELDALDEQIWPHGTVLD